MDVTDVADPTTERPEPGTVLRRRSAPAVVWVEVEQEIVAWNEEDESLHLLEPTAALVFQLCDAEASLQQTAVDLAEAFGADPTEVIDDVLACAASLEELGLVEVVA